MTLRLLLCSLSLAGCFANSGDPTTITQNAPPPEGAIPNVTHGRDIFGGTCEGCHNPYVLHTWTIANAGLTRDEMITRIRYGGPGTDRSDGSMPAITTERIPDADLPDLLAYLETIGAVDPM